MPLRVVFRTWCWTHRCWEFVGIGPVPQIQYWN